MLVRCFIVPCLVVLAYTAAAQDAPSRVPKIVPASAVFDFGDRENNGPIPYSFEIRNEGDARLKIDSVRPSCGCTVAELESNVVKPGESTVIKGEVDLPGRQGEITKMLTVVSNDPTQEALQLKITGVLTRKIYFSPSGLSIARIGVNEERTETIHIKTDDPNIKFSLEEVALLDTLNNEPPGFFEVSQEVVKEGQEYAINIRTKPPLPNRAIRANLMVKTNVEGYEELSAYVGASPMGPVTVSPQVMILPEPREGARPSTRRILLRPGTVDEFEILGVETPENFGASVKWTFKENVGYMIDLVNVLPTDANDGDEIVIKTDIVGMERISVPIRIIRPNSVPRRPASN